MRLSEMIYTEEELQQETRAKESWRDLYWEECEKNKKLKADSYNELQRLGLENYELREENRKLKEELERYKKQYEHSMGEDS